MNLLKKAIYLLLILLTTVSLFGCEKNNIQNNIDGNIDIENNENIINTQKNNELSQEDNTKVNKCSTFFYVSNDGNDQNEGTKDKPFRSIIGARDAIRELKKEDNYPEGGITVYLREGKYTLNSSIRMDTRDSGMEDSPIVYTSYPNEKVILTGGVSLNQEDFKKVKDKRVLDFLKSDIRDKIMYIDLKKAGIDNYGELSSHSPTQIKASEAELFFNNEPMILSRWPNDSYTLTGNIVDSGEKNKRGTSFKYIEDAPSNWNQVQNIWVNGFWNWDWANVSVPVSKVDTDENIVETSIAIEQYAVIGAQKGKRYYFYNILEELDAPREYYIDREEGKLYFYPPEDMNDSKIQISMLEESMIEMENVFNVRFEGLILEATRASGIMINGGANNYISGCILRNIGLNAVTINKGISNRVESCNIYNIGVDGVALYGGDFENLIPSENYVNNNHIYNFARRKKTYAFAIKIDGVGNTASHNKINEGYHIAINFNGNDHIIEYNEIFDVARECNDNGAIYSHYDNWAGRGNVIRYNYFHDIHGIEGFFIKSPAIYLDGGISGTHINHNIFENADMAVNIHGGRDNIVENNILIDVTDSVFIMDMNREWFQYLFDGMVEKLDDIKYKEDPYTKYPNLSNILESDYYRAENNKVLNNIIYNSGEIFVNVPFDLSLHQKAQRKLDINYEKIIKEYNKKYGEIDDNYIIEKEEKSQIIESNDSKFSIQNNPKIFDYISGFKNMTLEQIGIYKDKHRKYVKILEN